VTPAEAKAHAFVTDLAEPVLEADDRHHLERVLRMRPGDELTVSDGAGGWRPCRLGTGGSLEPLAEAERDPIPAPSVAVCFALVKGDRADWIVQKLTELGVDRITPFAAARSVVRWDGAKAGRQHARLVAIARGAAMQSRRTWLPTVDPLATFAQVTGLSGAALADRGGSPPSLGCPTVLVGPEGGWAADELACGLSTVALGTGVLRVETAAVTAGALLTALRAGLVGNVPSISR
jgi:16S rRNA (uracil1498-N3)-methyltransferase